MLPLEVLDALVKGQVKRHLVTIPEGYTLSQIAQLLEDLNIVEKKGFLQKASSPAFINCSWPLSQLGRTDTWKAISSLKPIICIREMDPEEVIQMMVHQFKKVFGPDLAQSGI